MFLAGDPNIPNAWIYSTQFVDRTGHPLTSQVLTNACPLLVSSPGPGQPVAGEERDAYLSHRCPPAPERAPELRHEDRRHLPRSGGLTSPPAVTGRFQWYELLIYLGVALVLAGACVWWVRRRLA